MQMTVTLGLGERLLIHSEEDTEMEQEDNAQATWTEEERTIFKLKIKTSIPLIYHGPVFNKSK